MVATCTRRMFVFLAMALAFSMFPQTSQASLLLESGPTYFIVQNDAGGTTGSVIMRMDMVLDSNGNFAVHSQILAISAEPGWSWVIRKPGGVNKAVEVQFFRGDQRFTFKALYVPGKTIIDNGTVR